MRRCEEYYKEEITNERFSVLSHEARLAVPGKVLRASEQTLKDLKKSQGHQRGSEESGFG